MRADREGGHYVKLLRALQRAGEIGLSGAQLQQRFGSGIGKSLVRLHEEGLITRDEQPGEVGVRWRYVRKDFTG